MKNMTRKYRRIFAGILLIAVTAGCWTITSCGRPYSDNPDYWAMVRLPNGDLVEGHGKITASFVNGLVTVEINGVRYQTHAGNVVICSEKP